jgi:ABC-type Fe3+ transport system permease subunit
VPQTRTYDAKDEATFLQQQAADAKVAIQQTLAEMQETAKAAADVRWWTQQYPWIAVGAATVLGFVAVTFLTRDGTTPTAAETTPHRSAAKPSLLSSLLSPLFTTLRSALVSAVISGVMDKVQEQELEQEQRIPPDRS